ncbi:hypothetical protein DXG01_002018 [Tephrocybe rancida]|nr:hypothetical protein DXG01_002018 [Tephrocybe rancida]
MSFYPDTRLYAPPVTRDGFSYYGNELNFEVDRHRHPRCGSSSLYSLLTYKEPSGPLLTKAGTVAKRQPTPHKDNPAHFYEAQCVHYGLKPYKTKAVAKKHLLAAFNTTTETLDVPPHIVALEHELKKEYVIANEAGKKKAQEEKANQEKQRQILQEQRRIEREMERARKMEEANAMVKEFAAAGIVIAKGTVSDAKGRAMANKPVSDAQLRKDLDALPAAQLRKVMEKLVFGQGTSSFKKAIVKEMAVLKEEQAAKALEAASKPKGRGKATEAKLLEDTLDDLGEYVIVAPYLRDNWSTTVQTSLKMSASPGQSHLWACFDFGIVSGIMRSYHAPPKKVGDTAEFHWKGGEQETSETYYGDENVASITFLGDGRIRGRMFYQSAGTFEFIGKKVPKQNVVWSRYVDSWKRQYREINSRSYEAANRARWGGWHDPGSDGDLTSNSDTSPEDRDLDGSEDDEEEDEELDYYAENNSKLYELITSTDPGSLLPTAGKKKPPGHKDNPLHFYEAQCLHYGLKRYKTRPAAKKHLLSAFNIGTKTLEVPSRILALEQALKEEYRAINAAAAKRAEEECARNTKQRQGQEVQRRLEYEKDRARKVREAKTMVKEFAAAGIVIATGKVPDVKGRPSAYKISDAQLRNDLTALPAAQLRALVEKLVFDKRSPTVKKKAVKEMAVMKKDQARKALAASDPKGKGKGNKVRLYNTLDDMGKYIVMAPYLRENWHDGTEEMSLKMSASPNRSHFWDWFNFGIVSGIMRSYSVPPTYVGDTVDLHWKGREGTGETSFGDDNVSSITFLGDGRIRGRIFIDFAGTCEFVGKRVPRENIIWSRSVKSWKGHYRDINCRS